MTKSVSDKLLLGLYQLYCQSPDYYARITTIIPNAKNWRIVASALFVEGLIEFSSSNNNGMSARLTKLGVLFCERTSFVDPLTPVVKLNDIG